MKEAKILVVDDELNMRMVLKAMLKKEGYQVKGVAELLTSGNLFEQVKKNQEMKKRPLPKQVVKIKVEEIYPV